MLGAVSAGLYLIDWNQYRDTLADLASERLGMQVELAGDLNLGLLPRPTVTAQAVRLSPLQSSFNDTIATADRIDMHLGLAALFSGSVELQSLAFEGLSAGLTETVEGWTIEGWPSALNSSADTSDATLLSLDRFRIKSGSITVRPLSSQEFVFDGVDVALSGRLPGGPLDILGTAFIEGDAISLTGRLTPTRTIGSTSVRFDFEVAESKLEFSGRSSDDGGVTGRFQASGKNLKALAAFINKATGSSVSTAQIPALPYGLDVQIERSSNKITRLISRQLKIGDTLGTVDLTLAQKGAAFHVTGSSSLGIIKLDRWLEAIAMDDSQSQSVDQGLLPVAGNIDISIEGVEFKDGLAQQVQASIALSGGQISLDQFRATLPGASRFAYVAEATNVGALKFKSGGLQEVFDWSGLSLSDAVPAGRLSTADIEGRLTIGDGTWVVSELTGTVDTTGIEAEISGRTNSFFPNALRVKLDQLNLDAYWPTLQFSGDTENANVTTNGLNYETQFQFEVGQLRWLQQSFDEIAVLGQFAANGITVSDMSIAHKEGSLTGNFSMQELEDRPADIEMALRFDKWAPAALAKLSPEVTAFLVRFSRDDVVNVMVSATGPMTELQTRLRVAAAENILEVAGTVNATEHRQVQLQGSVKHAHIDRILEVEELIGSSHDNGISTDLQASIEGAQDVFSFSANGMVAGGQTNFNGNYDKGLITTDVSLTVQAGIESELDALAGRFGVNLDNRQLRRLRLNLTKNDVSWRVEDLDARNGDGSIAGNINSVAGALNGELSVSNLNLGTLFSPLNGSRNGSENSFIPASGSVSMQATNVSWIGQSFNAPNAVISFNAGSSVFEVGQAATLNGGALQANIEIDDKNERASAVISAELLDIGALVQELSGNRGVTGTASASLNLQASLSPTGSMLETLDGEGRFEGGAGAMHFFAANELIALISNSTSSISFLQSVGNLLRAGDTDFANLSGSFRVDSGVALVDQITASGDWGTLALDGQVNLPGDYVNMVGQLSLTQPLDTPQIPVVYEGSLSSPNVRWTSRALEQFAIAGVERRLRSRIFGEMEKTGSGQSGSVQPSPGSAVFGVANSLLEKLRARQVEAKRREAEKQANDNAPSGDPASQGSVERML